jgi:hypothetical protein
MIKIDGKDIETPEQLIKLVKNQPRLEAYNELLFCRHCDSTNVIASNPPGRVNTLCLFCYAYTSYTTLDFLHEIETLRAQGRS